MSLDVCHAKVTGKLQGMRCIRILNRRIYIRPSRTGAISKRLGQAQVEAFMAEIKHPRLFYRSGAANSLAAAGDRTLLLSRQVEISGARATTDAAAPELHACGAWAP